MAKYIKVEDAIEAAINGCASWDGGYYPSMDDPIKDEFASIEDKCTEIVRCGECEHRKPPTDYCEKLRKAYVPDDFYCKYGERKEKEECSD